MNRRRRPSPIWLVVLLAGASSVACLDRSGIKKPKPTPPVAPNAPIPPAAQKPRCNPPLMKRYRLAPGQYDQCADVVHKARMARWRPLVWKTVGQDKDAFALLMTFIFVESGGNQFAVSRSGCAGLMQFCDSTALRDPFDKIFEIDQLRPCRCVDRKCRVSWDVRRLLEISDRALHPIFAADFPCDISDARFVPEQAVRAGWTYIKTLADAFESNPYLIYIGYNSGPAVAQRIWQRLGRRNAKRLKAIGHILRAELEPTFGPQRARRRARSLINVHLPKVERIYGKYLAWAQTARP